MAGFAWEKLRRAPDVEAPNLFAHDATDRLLTQRALSTGIAAGEIAVIGDEYGAMTLRLAAEGFSGIRVHQDLFTGRRALERNAAAFGLGGFASHDLDAQLLRGARLVLLQLPKSLAELEEISDAVARWAAPDVSLVAGGRVKHMTLAQNDVLGRYFARVQPERAEQKSRLVVASGPLAVGAEPPFPVYAQQEVPGVGVLTVAAHGGVFAGPRLDIGTRVLLDALAAVPQLRSGGGPAVPQLRTGADAAVPQLRSGAGAGVPQLRKNPGKTADPARDAAESAGFSGVVDAGGGQSSGVMGVPGGQDSGVVDAASRQDSGVVGATVVDLGCGSGILAAAFARQHPGSRVIATDRSAAAVRSARATIAANGLTERVEVTHDDARSALPPQSADVVLLNPPFHLGSTVHTGAAIRLFEAAARLLRPSGELYAVWNSSLRYRSQLEHLVGPTEQLARTPKFTVTRSVRASGRDRSPDPKGMP